MALKYCNVQHRNHICVFERYHGPLGNVFRIVSDKFPDIPRDLVLQLFVNEMNDTVEPEGLVPFLLIATAATVEA